MDGSIHKYVKNNRTHYYVSYRVIDPVSGKKVQKTKRGFTTKLQAKNFLIENQHCISVGTYVAPDKVSLANYLKDWLTNVEHNLSPTTVDSYQYIVDKHIIPHLGHIKLQQLRMFDLEKFYTQKKQNGRIDGKGGLSAKSILYIHRVLSKALSDAVKNQLLPRSITTDISLPKVKKYKNNVFDLLDIWRLLKAVQNSDMELPIALAALLGLRRGEVLGLTWSHVHLENKKITISQQLISTTKGILVNTPKTEESNRVINLPDMVIDIIKSHKKSQIEKRLLLGENYVDNNLVNCNNDGTMICPKNFSKRFAKIIEKHGFNHIRFHDLRHSCATLMLSLGIPMKTASKLLGHSNYSITADLYTHVLEEQERLVAQTIDNVFLNLK